MNDQILHCVQCILNNISKICEQPKCTTILKFYTDNLQFQVIDGMFKDVQ
jgi:hypothetical protein